MANDTDKRFVKIKDHFEEEAKIFDGNFFKIAPHYQEMIDTMALALPFKKNDRLKIIDLGCGTGNITKGIPIS